MRTPRAFGAPPGWPFRSNGLTLLELTIVVAIGALLLTLVGPSFRELIDVQRLRNLQSALVTDLALARSESISRASYTQVRFQNTSSMSCYVIYVRSDHQTSPTCDCTEASPANRCDSGVAEIKTVQVPASQRVTFSPSGTPFLTFDPRTGGASALALGSTEVFGANSFELEAQLDRARRFRTVIAQSGRVQVCTPAGSTVGGTAC